MEIFMSVKAISSPREAAAVVIETNKVLRQKLAKASTVIKNKNLQIKNMQQSFTTQINTLSKVEKDDSSEVDFRKYENVIAEQQEDIISLREKMVSLDDDNFKLKMEVEQLQSERDEAFDRIEYMSQNVSSNESVTENAETVRQLMIAMMHISGLEAELDAFKKEASDDCSLFKASDEEYEDGRHKSIARKTYELAFDRRAEELGISNPEDYRP
ncbi:MAG: hypothetical protein ACON4M_03740 [Crocinitomicaceae bacterium]